MPSKSKNSKPKVKVGQSALSSIIKTSKDQVLGVARNRYAKKGGLQQIAADMSELRKLLNTEEKVIDTTPGTNTVVVGASYITPIGTVAQGSNSNQRTGNSTKVIRTDFLAYFSFSSGTVATSNLQNQIFNWYLVKYLKTPSSSGSSAFGISDFLGADSNGNFSPLSLPNHDLNEDFSILANGQVRIDLDENTTAPSAKGAMIEVRIDRAFHQTYNGTAASNIVDNMCFLVVTAINPINTGGASTINAAIRQFYIDN
jgi:hypothetical protein